MSPLCIGHQDVAGALVALGVQPQEGTFQLAEASGLEHPRVVLEGGEAMGEGAFPTSVRVGVRVEHDRAPEPSSDLALERLVARPRLRDVVDHLGGTRQVPASLPPLGRGGSPLLPRPPQVRPGLPPNAGVVVGAIDDRSLDRDLDHLGAGRGRAHRKRERNHDTEQGHPSDRPHPPDEGALLLVRERAPSDGTGPR
jgi:hypothetical protein